MVFGQPHEYGILPHPSGKWQEDLINSCMSHDTVDELYSSIDAVLEGCLAFNGLDIYNNPYTRPAPPPYAPPPFVKASLSAQIQTITSRQQRKPQNSNSEDPKHLTQWPNIPARRKVNTETPPLGVFSNKKFLTDPMSPEVLSDTTTVATTSPEEARFTYSPSSSLDIFKSNPGYHLFEYLSG